MAKNLGVLRFSFFVQFCCCGGQCDSSGVQDGWRGSCFRIWAFPKIRGLVYSNTKGACKVCPKPCDALQRLHEKKPQSSPVLRNSEVLVPGPIFPSPAGSLPALRGGSCRHSAGLWEFLPVEPKAFQNPFVDRCFLLQVVLCGYLRV